METIYCEPLYGIGNRLMFMLSALRLSIKYKKKLIFIWAPDKDIDCDFCDLFSNFEFQTHKPDLQIEKSFIDQRYVVDLEKNVIYI